MQSAESISYLSEIKKKKKKQTSFLHVLTKQMEPYDKNLYLAIEAILEILLSTVSNQELKMTERTKIRGE